MRPSVMCGVRGSPKLFDYRYEYKYDGAFELIAAELSASGCGRTSLPFATDHAAAGRASDLHLEPRQQPKLGGIAIL